jgi:alpha-pyrone synthase
MPSAYLQRIATAVPDYDIHEGFVEFAAGMLDDPRARSIFHRLAAKSDIRHRYSCLAREHDPTTFSADAMTFYGSGISRSTAERMRVFERCAPHLARRALDRLALSESERSRIRHVLVTCCTGFYAPGLDFDAIDHLGLPASTERTFLGFMGCYAAINALKLARHIVRSQPESAALVLNLELCTLHFHQTQELSEALAFLLFGDGCSAALIGSEPAGLEMDSFHALRIDDSRDLITWRIGDLGFDMFLSTQVPKQISKAMRENAAAVTQENGHAHPIDLWAVHPGGRAILDAVEEGLDLGPDTLAPSRCILSRFGNMSSATVMFVLQHLMKEARTGQRGCAISFGPGLTAEIMRFHAA